MKKTLLVVVALALASGLAQAQKKQNRRKAFTDPAAAGRDFEIQGEYAGKSKAGDKVGAQVVALGDGKFDVYLLTGGLPGAGWGKKSGRKKVGAALEGERASLKGGGWAGYADGKKLVAESDGADRWAMEKVVRKSPTLGAKPPEGAVVLFDGTSADEWFARNKRPVKVVDGMLNTQGTGGLNTKKKFGDVKVHVEFLLSFMPYARGQGRSNSGVYYAGRHETQVLDSFGLAGRHNECGGLYTVKDPDVNMCLPPLSWQTYDVEYRLAKGGRGARITAKHNGVVIHKDVEIKKKGTTAAVDGGGTDSPGPLHFQDHGNPVFYRNVWIVKLK